VKFLIQWPSENGTNHTEVEQKELPRCGDKLAVALQSGKIAWLTVMWVSFCPDDLILVQAHRSCDEMQSTMDEAYAAALQFEGHLREVESE